VSGANVACHVILHCFRLVSLKKLAPYREREHKVSRDSQRRRVKQLLKESKRAKKPVDVAAKVANKHKADGLGAASELTEAPVAPTEDREAESPEEENDDTPVVHKKTRRRSKKSKKSEKSKSAE
jgi:hypothetical protein